MSGKHWRRALVVGLGVSGVEACRLLHSSGVAVRAYDQASEEALAARLAQLPPNVEVFTGKVSEALFTEIDVVVTSPGVPPSSSVLEQARLLSLPVLPEVELAYRFAGKTPIVGVTGSNGKSTVTDLVGQILRTAGLKVGVGGNLGTPASALVLEGSWEVMVWELSSFQLELISTLRPKVAVFCNFSPDHLDRHGTVEAYLKAKAKIFAWQKSQDLAVINADDPVVMGLSLVSQRRLFSLRSQQADAYRKGEELVFDGKALLSRKQLPLLGDHNVANALAAALACRGVGVPPEAIALGLRHAKPLPHRHQLVAETGGVRFVDDSKATNVGAVVSGLAGYPDKSVHLILGGLGKGQDFSLLLPVVRKTVARAYLIGEAAPALQEILAGEVPVEPCGTLAEAVRRAKCFARAGEVVLLAPACASFDQFRDYAHRGKEFTRLVQEAEREHHAQT